VAASENEQKPVSLSEVKSILKKIEKERKELSYEQKIALEHSQKFARLPIKKTNDLIKELSEQGFLQESHVYKIVDLLPSKDDDVKTIFAKERITLNDSQIKKILEIVKKYLSEQ
jgi:DNA-directed RNA polymerase subunit F